MMGMECFPVFVFMKSCNPHLTHAFVTALDLAVGKRGRLVDVLRTTNEVDTFEPLASPGGHLYEGAERSDVHGAIVVFK